MQNFLLEMQNFLLEMQNFLLEMQNFLFEMQNFCSKIKLLRKHIFLLIYNIVCTLNCTFAIKKHLTGHTVIAK
jgi:hypothetical protein